MKHINDADLDLFEVTPIPLSSLLLRAMTYIAFTSIVDSLLVEKIVLPKHTVVILKTYLKPF